MFELFKRKYKADKKQYPDKRAPYDERHKDEMIPLSAVVTIVPRHQEDFFTNNYSELNSAMSIVLYGYSNPPKELLAYLGDYSNKKSIIITPCRTEDVDKLLKVAEERFSVSNEAKGIAFSMPITSIAGIATYKFFADIQREVRLQGEKKSEDKEEVK